MTMWLNFALLRFSCKLNSALLNNGPAPGFESSTFVTAVFCDQAMGSAMYNTSALQEKSAEGHEEHTYTVRVILPQTGSHDQ